MQVDPDGVIAMYLIPTTNCVLSKYIRQCIAHTNTTVLTLETTITPIDTTMALAPKFAGQKLASSAINPKAVHTIELCKTPAVATYPTSTH